MVIKPGIFTYDQPLVSLGVVKANIKVFAVQTNIEHHQPASGYHLDGCDDPERSLRHA